MNPLLGIGLGTAGAGIGQLFAGGKNPADAAMPYLNQIPGTISPYYQPYINAGNQALPTLQNQYNNLISNPGNQLNTIGQGYQQSPGYQFSVDQATKASNQAAAAGGMLGSPAQQYNLSQDIIGMANQDYYNWLNQALGLYNTGLGGLSGINQMGYGASTDLASSLAQSLQNQANLAYAGQTNQNQTQGGGWGAALSGIGSAIGSFF